MTTVAAPDTRSRMNTTLVVRPDQPARADAMDALLRPSRRGDSLHAPQRRIKAVKVGRWLWLKPGAKVKGSAK